MGSHHLIEQSSVTAALIIALKTLKITVGDSVALPINVCRSALEAIISVGATSMRQRREALDEELKFDGQLDHVCLETVRVTVAELLRQHNVGTEPRSDRGPGIVSETLI